MDKSSSRRNRNFGIGNYLRNINSRTRTGLTTNLNRIQTISVISIPWDRGEYAYSQYMFVSMAFFSQFRIGRPRAGVYAHSEY